MISRNVKCFWRERLQKLFRQLSGTTALIDWNMSSVTLSLVKVNQPPDIYWFSEALLFVVYLSAAREILAIHFYFKMAPAPSGAF